MITAGIDYSMTSPGLCVYDDVKNHVYWYGFGKKKQQGVFKGDGYTINIIEYPAWDNAIERSTLIANAIVKVLQDHKVEGIALEGYSFGSRAGLIFQIAEHTAILKFFLKKDLHCDIRIYSPSQVKKFASTKGNANKDVMADAFLQQTSWNMHDILETKKGASPSSDLIDAFFLARIFNSQEFKTYETI